MVKREVAQRRLGLDTNELTPACSSSFMCEWSDMWVLLSMPKSKAVIKYLWHYFVGNEETVSILNYSMKYLKIFWFISHIF